MILEQYDFIQIIVSEKEDEAVKIAVTNLRRDLRRVLEARVDACVNTAVKKINIGTISILEASQEMGSRAELVPYMEKLKEKDRYRKEAFLIKELGGELWIIGTDRRGTIYGIYDFCEWMGVSPWYFWADVPIRLKEQLVIEDNYTKVDYPSVEYRGIFINDEEELEKWVQRYMGEDTIGVKTYAYVFELLLRLKMNYIWPAMHVNSFNLKQENGALANRMGIVIGTSHCDMLMRSNNREWKPWIQKKGYTDIEYDYSIPGRNREVLNEYWRESVEQNKDFEVSYTLGMRGIHDSGFETKTLAGKSGRELLEAKIELLDTVIKAQEGMIAEVLDEEPLKIFVPYKEVLELYDNGLEVPEDLTLIWVNDNYGHVRRYPGEMEKQRKSGNGIYYHNSYWAPPGGSYLFICSIPLSHTRNELMKAYQEGIRKLWVTNFGAMKPLEQQMTFYARLAWEAGREDAITNDEQAFLAEWMDKTFSGGYGNELAKMLTEFDQLTNVRKLEQMDVDAFSQTAYGDEAAMRIHRYERLFERGNEIYQELPSEEKDAFFQLVLMKLHAAYYTNCMYYYADRSNLCIAQGKNAAAAKYTRISLEYDEARRKMLHYYNHVMANGKWNGILTPEDFPPPRTAMHPACKPPLAIGEKKLIVTLWNDAKELVLYDKTDIKWLELANAGIGVISYEITAPDWLTLSTIKGELSKEERVMVSATASQPMNGVIVIRELGSGNEQEISVSYLHQEEKEGISVEKDGMVSVEATDASEIRYNTYNIGWKTIQNLGRDHGALVEAVKEGATLSYSVETCLEGEFTLELHRFPSLNSVGRIRVGVSVDDGEVIPLESESNDEYRGNWKKNIRNNVDKLYLKLPWLWKGSHKITLHAIDRYFAFSRFVIYTEARKENNLGCRMTEAQSLPKEQDVLGFAKEFYGEVKLLPRPTIYLPKVPIGDTLTMEDIVIVSAAQGEPVTPSQLLARGKYIFAEEKAAICIDVAAALANTEFAYYKDITDSEGNYRCWDYCNSPSYNGTGLAMYIRQEFSVLSQEEAAPALHYRIRTTGGNYTVWVHAHMWGADTSWFTIGLDEKRLSLQEIYNGRKIWRYSLEQVWEWIPVCTVDIAEGEHELSIYAMSSHLRFDRIWLTKREELPPIDAQWTK